MLTIGKIGGTGGGQWRQPGYYTEQVAHGAEDYYSGKGEAPGTWTGGGAAALGLDGALGEGDLEALFDRCHPASGDQLGRPPGERAVRGIDLQMAVPKSVSALWALADEYEAPDVSGRVWEATRGAADATLDSLERQACTSRAGAGGHIALRGEGFVGAVFPHRFSREGDPQIHVHVLVANMTACEDAVQGVERGWRTLDARDLYRHQRTAGCLFQAELRERLTCELGVEWTNVHKGAAEIAGVPRELMAALSKRRAQILDALDRAGRAGTPAETQLAALNTRKAKQSFDLPKQRQRWRALAEEHGFGYDEFHGALGRAELRLFDRQDIGDEVARLVGPRGLTEQRSTFTRRDVIERLAAAHTRGGSVERIEELADRLIASDHVVALDHHPAGAVVRGEARKRAEPLFTTAEMLALEADMVDRAATRAAEGAAVVTLGDEERFERRPGGLVLLTEQQEMVHQLVTSGSGVDIVRAKAGTGKTTAIDAARELWERDGYRVIGTALSGRAADELRARGGIDSYTLHGLLAELDRGEEWSLTPSTVVVVDEAGMVGSRQLSALLDHADHGRAKVVLIGDEHQVPAIEAGGAFAGLADRLGAIELNEVHRQRHAWDRDALDQLRHGDVGAWAAAYERHGRLVPCPGPDAQMRAVVERWYVAGNEHGMVDTLMLASHRHEVDDLNQLARAARVAAGELDDATALNAAERSFAEGDRVLALRNRHVERADGTASHQLRNGNRGTVTRIDHETGQLVVALDTGTEVTLAADYLHDGHLTHGYATTIHKSQGITTTRTFVLGSPDLARELGYVASSRHTDEARFFINAGNLADRQPPPLEQQPFYADLERALGRERAKHLALDETETEIDAQVGQLTTAELLEISDRGRTVLSTIPAQARRAKDAELLELAARRVADAEQRLAAARDELAGVGRFERRGRAQLQRRVEGLETALEAGRQQLTERTDAATSLDIETFIEQHELDLSEATTAESELASRRADAHWRATRMAALDPDPAIERELGQRPDEPAARERWERAAAAHESYRLQYGELPDRHDPANLPDRQTADWHHTRQLAERVIDPPRLPTHADLGPDLSP